MRKTKRGWQFYAITKNLLNDSCIRTEHRSRKQYVLEAIKESKSKHINEQYAYTSTLHEARETVREYFKQVRKRHQKEEAQMKKLEKIHKLK